MKIMKWLVVVAAVFAMANPTFAAKDKDKDKEAKDRKVTITGEAKCGKCALKQSDKCQNVVEAENKGGKKVSYVLADNQVSKDFHKNVCKENKQVTVTGTAKKGEGKGKFDLTATSIELVKVETKAEEKK